MREVMSEEKQFEMVGVDGQQYGPLSESELRAYVVERRANADTQIREVGAESWQSLGNVLGLDSLRVVSHSQQLGAAVPSDTPLDFSAALSDGWQLFKEHMGLMIGAGAIFFGILMAAGLVGAVIPGAQILVQGPLMGGLILLILKLSREGHAEIGDLFLGFKNYGWLLLVTVVQGAILFASMLPGLILLIIGAVTLAQEEKELGIGLMVVGGLLMFILAMLATVLTNYALYLVAEKRGTFGEAFLAGYKGAKKNFWGIFAMMIMIGLASMLGVITCGLGLLFTIPWSLAVMVKAYEQIFPLPADQSA